MLLPLADDEPYKNNIITKQEIREAMVVPLHMVDPILRYYSRIAYPKEKF